jgi:hypothetical protein
MSRTGVKLLTGSFQNQAFSGSIAGQPFVAVSSREEFLNFTNIGYWACAKRKAKTEFHFKKTSLRFFHLNG